MSDNTSIVLFTAIISVSILIGMVATEIGNVLNAIAERIRGGK